MATGGVKSVEGAEPPRGIKNRWFWAVLLLLYLVPVNLYTFFVAHNSAFMKGFYIVLEAAVLVWLFYVIFRYRPNPLTRKKVQRFRMIRRGYASYLVLAFLMLISFFGAGELLVNSRALIVKYEGKIYLPTYGAIQAGTEFGLDYSYETNYRELQKKFREEGSGNWVVMPVVPFNPLENDFVEGVYGPTPPSLKDQHFLGTDNTGRDILARLFYGFRSAMVFSLIFMFLVYAIGIAIGCAMGFYGGTFDLLVQRLIEIWGNLPFLYIVIIVGSIIRPTFGILLAIFIIFSWMGMTYYMRTSTYKEKERDYTAAARLLGASNFRIIFSHILPNTISTIVTFMPFTIAGSITSLTALDFLGFGLPPPTPSWGELLRRGIENLQAPWIVSAAFGGLVVVLILVTFVGEAIREAFDPKKFSTYQ